MPTRFRWLTIEPFVKKHVAALSAVLASRLYGETERTGFDLHTARGDRIEGEFIRRLDFNEEILDPVGHKISVSRVSLQRTGFKLTLKSPQLELIDPAQNARDLIERIAGALNYSVSISPIEIDPLAWARAIRLHHPSLKILGIKTGDFSLTNEAVGAFAIKGTQDVEKLIPLIAGKRSVSTVKVACSWLLDQGEAKVELRRAGVGVVVKGNCDELKRILADSLASLLVFPRGE